jgi:hypothetical protein
MEMLEDNCVAIRTYRQVRQPLLDRVCLTLFRLDENCGVVVSDAVPSLILIAANAWTICSCSHRTQDEAGSDLKILGRNPETCSMSVRPLSRSIIIFKFN